MPLDASPLSLDVPEKLIPIFKPARYKAAYGGRGSGKSHTFAAALIARCWHTPTRAVCIREVQDTIRDSVRQLLIDKITAMGVEADFTILDSEIRGHNGSLIIFKGMQSFNAANIKSLEGYDICWVEEAQTLSAVSWRLLRPTIRKDASEIWCTWNPLHATDAVDEFFRGENPPRDAVVIECNWRDNPWFTGTLREEMERDRRADPDMAGHVWDGGYEVVSEGSYYARWLSAAEREGRIGNFPYRPGKKVQTSWDLGIRDHSVVWFWVEDVDSVTVVDYYETAGDGFDSIVSTCLPELFIPPPLDTKFVDWNRDRALSDFGRAIPFEYADHWLPHDIRVRDIARGGRARHESLRELGLVTIRKGSAASPEDRINASRKLLPVVRFNNTKRIQRGIQRLRQYKRKFNELMGEWQEPLHDENSHAADSFSEFAINCPLLKIIEKAEKPKPVSTPAYITDDDGQIVSNMSIDELIRAKRQQNARYSYRTPR